MNTNNTTRAQDDLSDRNGNNTAIRFAVRQQPAPELELPPLSAEDQAALASFHQRQSVLRDVTIGCILGLHTGAYIYGPPGVSKSHTVMETLRANGAYWRPHQRITAKPLYLEMEKHKAAHHVVDDCEQLFFEKGALTLIRSALGGERVNGHRERPVCYSVGGSRARELTHYFSGSLIFTANRALTDDRPEIAAIMSRIFIIEFAPPDGEIRALMRHVARQGYHCQVGRMGPHECVEVIEFVIQLAAELGGRLDLRWIEHAYHHYLTQVIGHGGNDWRDMAKIHLMRTITHFDYTPSIRTGKPTPACAVVDEDDAAQIAIAQEIRRMPGLNKGARMRLWEERTGHSPATYYRRLQQGRTDPAT